MNDLSNPPTIRQRIQAAMLDDYPYQVVHYMRKEGATHAVKKIAGSNKRVLILGNPRFKRYYTDTGAAFASYFEDPHKYDGRDFEVIIADVVPGKELRKWRSYIRETNKRLIAIKGIRIDDYDGKAYVAMTGLDLETGTGGGM